MPYYVVKGEMRQVEKPDLPNLPDWEAGQLPVFPERPSLPPGWEKPEIPPREEWPPLPPWFEPHPGQPLPPSLPIPPDWGHPSVPLPPDPEVDPPPVWPPMPPTLPDLPDLSGKTLVLARFYVSRHVNYLRWVVIDHAEAKSKLQKAMDWVKAHWPAGGIGGTPPQRPQPH